MGTTKLRDITALAPAELAAAVSSWGQPVYRIEQLERWLWERGAGAFEEMSDLPAPLRARLAAEFHIPALAPVEQADDGAGTTKYLFRTHDGLLCETVYMPGEDYDAACLSSQIGCAFGCRICATGRLKFRRNLTAFEIVNQFIRARRRPGGERLRNALFMGQGEPLANAAAVAEAANRLKRHLGVGMRRITVSTVGVPDALREWADRGPPVKLAVSLNSAVQRTRDIIMPGMKAYPLTELLAACRHYGRRAGRTITFEYVLCAGINDDAEHGRALAAFARRVPSKINVIPFNPWPRAPYRPPTEETLERFVAALAGGPTPVTVRRSRGRGVQAACGMLASRALAPKAGDL